MLTFKIQASFPKRTLGTNCTLRYVLWIEFPWSNKSQKYWVRPNHTSVFLLLSHLNFVKILLQRNNVSWTFFFLLLHSSGNSTQSLSSFISFIILTLKFDIYKRICHICKLKSTVKISKYSWIHGRNQSTINTLNDLHGLFPLNSLLHPKEPLLWILFIFCFLFYYTVLSHVYASLKDTLFSVIGFLSNF